MRRLTDRIQQVIQTGADAEEVISKQEVVHRPAKAESSEDEIDLARAQNVLSMLEELHMKADEIAGKMNRTSAG